VLAKAHPARRRVRFWKALRRKRWAWLSQVLGRQINVGKPILAHPTSSTIRLQVSHNMLAKVLERDLLSAPTVNATDNVGLVPNKVIYTMVEDLSGI
jgi:hypothetical protein